MLRIIESLNKGLLLSIYTFLFSIILDFSVSHNTLKEIIDKDKNLYIEGMRLNIINLFILSPIYYIFLDIFFFNNVDDNINFYKFGGITLTHNVLYYICHMGMHKIKYLQNFHEFHHRYNITIPSSGNAVSISEYNFAYVLPFVLGIILFRPNSITLKSSVLLISFFNTIIHCKELHNIIYPKFMVSPSDHGIHHKYKTCKYSAPIINIDKIIKGN